MSMVKSLGAMDSPVVSRRFQSVAANGKKGSDPPPIGTQKVPLDHISSAAARFTFSITAVRRNEPLTTKAERDTEREQQHEDHLWIISFGGSTWLG